MEHAQFNDSTWSHHRVEILCKMVDSSPEYFPAVDWDLLKTKEEELKSKEAALKTKEHEMIQKSKKNE